MSAKYWLLKAEPDSRIVKGKDVKFSVDDFERVNTSPWEGVRNYEARNLMKEMEVGEKAVFYHSNCKSPGIAAFAEVAKPAYPDYTAWDASHPYYDPKSDKDKPRWYMVDLKFTARAEHFIPLALLRYIADTAADELPAGIKYIGEDGVKAIQNMGLVTRGRLSVQRVEAKAWDTIHLLANNGGWADIDLKPRKKPTKASTVAKSSSKHTKIAIKKHKSMVPVSGEDGDDSPLSSLDSGSEQEKPGSPAVTVMTTVSRKRKVPPENDTTNNNAPRRSRRHKVSTD